MFTFAHHLYFSLAVDAQLNLQRWRNLRKPTQDETVEYQNHATHSYPLTQ
jgi:hypothetical protein